MEDKFNKLWDSLEQSERQVPSDAFLERMELLAVEQIAKPKVISIRSFMGIAASLLILVFANFYIINNTNNTAYSDTNTSLQEEYSLIPNPLI